MHPLFWFRDSGLLIDFDNVKTYGKREFFYDTSKAFFAIFVIVTGTYARLGGNLHRVLCDFIPTIVIARLQRFVKPHNVKLHAYSLSIY
jgi:hypothetical protein